MMKRMNMKYVIACVALATLSAMHASAQEKSSRIGAWDVLEIKDAFSDKARTIVSLTEGTNLLIIKCDDPGSVYISVAMMKDWIGEGRYRFREVMLRFDALPAYRQIWAHNDRSVTAINRESVSNIVSQLLAARKLALRAWDFEGQPHDAMFDVPPETVDAINTVYKGCEAGDAPAKMITP